MEILPIFCSIFYTPNNLTWAAAAATTLSLAFAVAFVVDLLRGY